MPIECKLFCFEVSSATSKFKYANNVYDGNVQEYAIISLLPVFPRDLFYSMDPRGHGDIFTTQVLEFINFLVAILFQINRSMKYSLRQLFKGFGNALKCCELFFAENPCFLMCDYSIFFVSNV